MFAQVAVEAEHAVVSALDHPLLLQKVYGQNRRVTAVSAANGKGPTFQVGERRNSTPASGDDLGHPAEIGVAHGHRAAGVAAPLVRLQVSEVRIPCNIYTWYGI